jgi:hypothetical protein
MANSSSPPFGSSAPTAVATGSAPPNPTISAAGPSRESRQPIVRYVGFRSTDHGREYVMQVSEGLSTRSFVLLIPHHAFASKQARFQDGPDLCSGKLRRELAVDPDLPGNDSIAVTAQDLVEYHDNHARAPGGGRSRAKL